MRATMLPHACGQWSEQCCSSGLEPALPSALLRAHRGACRAEHYVLYLADQEALTPPPPSDLLRVRRGAQVEVDTWFQYEGSQVDTLTSPPLPALLRACRGAQVEVDTWFQYESSQVDTLTPTPPPRPPTSRFTPCVQGAQVEVDTWFQYESSIRGAVTGLSRFSAEAGRSLDEQRGNWQARGARMPVVQYVRFPE